MKNKYARLLGNTMIFAIGTFSSKVLVFFMMRYYTAVLDTADFGISDLITQSANVLIPIATVSITSGIIRFGLIRSNDKRQIFSIGVVTVFCGYAFFTCFISAFKTNRYICTLSVFNLFICAYIITSASVSSVCKSKRACKTLCT